MGSGRGTPRSGNDHLTLGSEPDRCNTPLPNLNPRPWPPCSRTSSRSTAAVQITSVQEAQCCRVLPSCLRHLSWGDGMGRRRRPCRCAGFLAPRWRTRAESSHNSHSGLIGRRRSSRAWPTHSLPSPNLSRCRLGWRRRGWRRRRSWCCPHTRRPTTSTPPCNSAISTCSRTHRVLPRAK